MATTIKRTSEAQDRDEGLATIPSPAQVRATAEEIRRSWTPDQRRRRAQLARSMVRQKFSVAATIRVAGPQQSPLTPKCPHKRS